MEETTKILVVDDNPEIREIIQILLEGEGYAISQAENGAIALQLLSEESFDLIILDIMMPQLNGYQTCVRIRERSNAPILFLSARTKESDKTLGFSSGGDDYLAKPFSYAELVSRTKALLRRYQVYQGKDAPAEKKENVPDTILWEDMELRKTERTVLRGGKPLDLTDTEFELLLLLVSNRGQNFSAERLYETVWGEPYYYGANNTVMVHIRNLRRKIEKDSKNPVLVKTVWGRGYRCD